MEGLSGFGRKRLPDLAGSSGDKGKELFSLPLPHSNQGMSSTLGDAPVPVSQGEAGTGRVRMALRDASGGVSSSQPLGYVSLAPVSSRRLEGRLLPQAGIQTR